MYAYTLTEQETRGWESTDGRKMDEARSIIRLSAKLLARDYGHRGAEIYSHDGVVLDVVLVDND